MRVQHNIEDTHPKRLKKCVCCGKEFLPNGGHQRWCNGEKCLAKKREIQLEQRRERTKRYRAKKKNSTYVPPRLTMITDLGDARTYADRQRMETLKRHNETLHREIEAIKKKVGNCE